MALWSTQHTQAHTHKCAHTHTYTHHSSLLLIHVSVYMQHAHPYTRTAYTQGLFAARLRAGCRSRSVSIHNATDSALPPSSSALLMWCPFHCWMPCCCPQRHIHPAMMSVLGSHSNSQLVRSFKASTIHCIIIGQPVLEASLCLLLNHAIKLKITRKILGSGQLVRCMCGTGPLSLHHKQHGDRMPPYN